MSNQKCSVFGIELTKREVEMKYVSIATLIKVVDTFLGGSVFANHIIAYSQKIDLYWNQINGNEDDVFQWLIISEEAAGFLQECSDESVFYNDDLNLYLWGITTYGTSWDYVPAEVCFNDLIKAELSAIYG